MVTAEAQAPLPCEREPTHPVQVTRCLGGGPARPIWGGAAKEAQLFTCFWEATSSQGGLRQNGVQVTSASRGGHPADVPRTSSPPTHRGAADSPLPHPVPLSTQLSSPMLISANLCSALSAVQSLWTHPGGLEQERATTKGRSRAKGLFCCSGIEEVLGGLPSGRQRDPGTICGGKRSCLGGPVPGLSGRFSAGKTTTNQPPVQRILLQPGPKGVFRAWCQNSLCVGLWEALCSPAKALYTCSEALLTPASLEKEEQISPWFQHPP